MFNITCNLKYFSKEKQALLRVIPSLLLRDCGEKVLTSQTDKVSKQFRTQKHKGRFTPYDFAYDHRIRLMLLTLARAACQS